MLVIYAEKGSLAKTIAAVLHAGQRIPLKGEPTVGYYQFQYHGEDAVLCHGIGHLMQLVPAKSYDAKYAKWDLSVFPCIPQQFRLAAMELAGQNIEDEEIRTLMKLQKKGLGTDATRAPILKGLFDRHYLERKSKTIFPTDKGMFLIDAIPMDAIKSADMTGDWEMRLNNIALGKENPAQLGQ